MKIGAFANLHITNKSNQEQQQATKKGKIVQPSTFWQRKEQNTTIACTMGRGV